MVKLMSPIFPEGSLGRSEHRLMDEPESIILIAYGKYLSIGHDFSGDCSIIMWTGVKSDLHRSTLSLSLRTDTCALKNSPRVKAIVENFSAAWNIWQANKSLLSHGRRLSQRAIRLQFHMHLKPQLLFFLLLLLLLFLVSVVVFVVSQAL